MRPGEPAGVPGGGHSQGKGPEEGKMTRVLRVRMRRASGMGPGRWQQGRGGLGFLLRVGTVASQEAGTVLNLPEYV